MGGGLLNVWVAGDVLARFGDMERWVGNAGFAVVKSVDEADVTVGAFASVGVGFYSIGLTEDGSADVLREMLARGFDQVLIEPPNEARLTAALVLAEVRSMGARGRELREILNSTPDLISLNSLEGRILWANQAHEEILQYSPSDMVGKTSFDLIHPDDAARAAAALANLLADQPVNETEVRLRRKDGHYEQMELSARVLPGARPRLVVVSRPLADRMESVRLLRESEERFRTVVDVSPDLVTILDEEGLVTFANQAHRSRLGLDPKELLGRNSATLIHPDDRATAYGAFQAVVSEGQPTTTSLRLGHADGRWLRFDIAAGRFNGPGGSTGLVVISRDETVRETAMAQLARLSTTLTAQQENSLDGILVVDENRKAISYNRRYLEIWRIPASVADEGLGERTAHVLEALSDPEETLRLVSEVYADPGRTFSSEVLLTDGRRLEMHTAPLVGEDGTNYGRAWYYRDVTARRMVEEALKESEERYRELVESSPDAIAVHDGETILYANPAAARLSGVIDPQTMVGQLWTDFLANPPADQLAERIIRVRDKESYTVEEPRFIVKRKLTTQLEMSIAPTMFNGQAAIQTVIRDVSGRRRAEQERLTLERALLETQKLESLGVMAGGIAHDFNNLLVAIMGNAGLATMELPKDSPARDYLHEIETASQRAADLARQMLAYSGKGHFIVSWCELGELVEEMGNLLRASLSRKVRLHYQLAADLPQIQCDATQIRQIVMNLVINAAESIGDRDGVITVTTGEVEVQAEDYAAPGEELKPGRHVFLDVRDTGVGMDEATRARIFEPFFTTKFTGRGLGLAAVLGIARGHSGAIRVESSPGAGTTFRLLLPAKSGAPSPAPAAGNSATPTRGRILVVDDEESVRRVAQGMLQRLGYEVVVCRDATEALDAVAQSAKPFNALLLDMLMPGSGGSDVLRRLREAGTACPVVFMSGYSEDEALDSLPKGTPAAFLQKPFTLDELREVVEQVTPSREG